MRENMFMGGPGVGFLYIFTVKCAGMQRCFDIFPSPLGDIVAVSGDGLRLESMRFAQRGLVPEGAVRGGAPVLETCGQWLEEYFTGKVPGTSLPLDLGADGFRRDVLTALLEIPYGHTVTYAQLAVAAGFAPGAARAVGGAVGSNPLCIAVPCHRVVGSGGRPGGYRWGLWRKKALLDLEAGALF